MTNKLDRAADLLREAIDKIAEANRLLSPEALSLTEQAVKAVREAPRGFNPDDTTVY
jgi:hypothetical protein